MADKSTAAGLTPLVSEAVAPANASGCPVHLEATVEAVQEPADGGFAIVETHVVRVHVERDLVLPWTSYVNTSWWQPPTYVFRHYFHLGRRGSRNFRAEYSPDRPGG